MSKHTKIMNNWFSHLICKVWFDVSAIAFIPTRTIIISKKFNKRKEWIQNATIKHEIIHMDQADRDGTIRMIFRYIFSKEQRLKYEVEAYTENIMTYVDNNYPFNTIIQHYAKILAGRTYLHMTDEETAEKMLRKSYEARCSKHGA